MDLTLRFIASILPIRNINMRSFIRLMKACSDPNRVKIIKLLQHKTMCVCELQGALGVAQPTVSKHLKILEEAGVVESIKDGLWVNYYLADGSGSPYVANLIGNLKHWLNDDPEVVELTNKIPFLDRETLCRK